MTKRAAIIPLPEAFSALPGAAYRLPWVPWFPDDNEHTPEGREPTGAEYLTPEGLQLATNVVDLLCTPGTHERLIAWIDEQTFHVRQCHDADLLSITHQRKIKHMLTMFDCLRRQRVDPFIELPYFLTPDEFIWDLLPEEFTPYIPYMERLYSEGADRMFKALSFNEWGPLEALYEEYEANDYDRLMSDIHAWGVTRRRESILVPHFVENILACAADVRASWDWSGEDEDHSEPSQSVIQSTYLDAGSTTGDLSQIVNFDAFSQLDRARQLQRLPDPVTEFAAVVSLYYDESQTDLCRSAACELIFSRGTESRAELEPIQDTRFAILEALLGQGISCQFRVDQASEVVRWWCRDFDENSPEMKMCAADMEANEGCLTLESQRAYLALARREWNAAK